VLTGLCRDCLAPAAPADRRCRQCASPRLLRHPELGGLTLAHIDCDAFYASIEKRDDPALRDRPVIVGGGRRGVVSAACYIARTYGVRSAMPMFKALKACPEAAVIRPDMEKYARVGRQVREIMLAATPLVEPLSLDEAFLDLAGTEALHRRSAAETLAALVLRIEREVGIAASVGLSYCKFLAKVASDLDKPRGFAVLGRAEAKAFLASRPVGTIWGVGKALGAQLGSDGIERIGQLQEMEEIALMRRYGSMGRRLYRFARGEDDRRVEPNAPPKSISAETTFENDLADPAELRAVLWRMAEKLSDRLKRRGLAAGSVTLKLRTADFRILTRHRRPANPTQLADILFRTAGDLLAHEADGRRFRLLGVGADGLVPADLADPPDLADPDAGRRAAAERAVDRLRARFGGGAIGKGRGFAA